MAILLKKGKGNIKNTRHWLLWFLFMKRSAHLRGAHSQGCNLCLKTLHRPAYRRDCNQSILFLKIIVTPFFSISLDTEECLYGQQNFISG